MYIRSAKHIVLMISGVLSFFLLFTIQVTEVSGGAKHEEIPMTKDITLTIEYRIKGSTLALYACRDGDGEEIAIELRSGKNEVINRHRVAFPGGLRNMIRGLTLGFSQVVEQENITKKSNDDFDAAIIITVRRGDIIQTMSVAGTDASVNALVYRSPCWRYVFDTICGGQPKMYRIFTEYREDPTMIRIPATSSESTGKQTP